MTNADKIRILSDEDIANWITRIVSHTLEQTDGDYEVSESFESDALKWLKEEVAKNE